MYGKKLLIFLLVLVFLLFFCFCSDNKEIEEKSIDDLGIEINAYFINSSKRLIKLSEQIQNIMNKGMNDPINTSSINKFRPFDNIVYYNPKIMDDCAYWYSGYDKSEDILNKLHYHERFEQYIKDAAVNQKLNNYVFLISMDNIIISYPYVNFLVYISPDTDFRKLINDNYRRSQAKSSWSVPYLDTMGTGYVTSYKKFILNNSVPRFQVLIDISIPDLYGMTIKHLKTPMMIIQPPNYLVAVNKSCRELFNISGKENKFYLKDVKVESKKTSLQNTSLNKINNPDLFEVLNKIEGKSSTYFNHLGYKYEVKKKKIDANGWLLMGFFKI